MGNKKSGIFLNWLQNFTMLVFTQSFHAIFLVFLLKMMSAVLNQEQKADLFNNTTGILAVVSIAGSMALIKFEKIIRQLFGIGDSKFMGGLGDNFAKSLMAVRSGVDLANRTAEPFKKYAENNKKRENLSKRIKNYKPETGSKAPSASGGRGSSGSVVGVSTPGANNYNTNTFDAPDEAAGANGGKGRISDLVSALERNTAALANSTDAANTAAANDKENELAKLQKELAEADAAARTNLRQMFTRTGSTIAAAGFGLGATEDASNLLTVTNLVDAPLDYMSDRAIKRSVYGNKSRELDRQIVQVEQRIKAENPTLDASEIEKAVERATKGLQEAKISIDDKIPDSLRKNLANVWKDVQSDPVTRRIVRTRKPRRAGTDNVEDI